MSTEPNPNLVLGPLAVGEIITPPPRPVSPSTASYIVNHTAIRIKDPEKSLRFYCDGLGMHVVFICRPGPWTIWYLAPRDVDATTLTSSRGLLELIHIPSDASLPYTHSNAYTSSPPSVGFSHLGLTVPDVASAFDRAMAHGGSKVIKRLGEVVFEDGEMIAGQTVDKSMREGKGPEEGGCAEWFSGLMRGMAFVGDPDGYWIELVPQQISAESLAAEASA